MNWTAPTFDEIKMDAEIGSYQEEKDRDFEVPFANVARTSEDAAAE
jgi:hypothetical protein